MNVNINETKNLNFKQIHLKNIKQDLIHCKPIINYIKCNDENYTRHVISCHLYNE